MNKNGAAPRPELGPCWEWTGGTHAFGYGTFKTGKRTYAAHRFAMSITRGIPEGMWVLHKCDNPPCCNPDHLFLGTQLDNMRDKMAKGRERWKGVSKPGAANPAARLTEAQVLEARRLRTTGLSYAKLAGIFGVTKSAIWLAVTGKSWKLTA